MAKLRFKEGTMNSSKTAQLLMVRHNYIEQGKKVIVFKPQLDTRDGEHVKSRALGEKAPAIMISSFEKGKMFSLTENISPVCVLIDEVQFMPEHQIDELAKIVDLLGIPVIAYGLLTDFQTKLFEGSKRLIEIGAVVENIKTVCWDCSKAAVFNMRLLNGLPVFTGEQVQVGGNESYKPVCRGCYYKAKSQTCGIEV
jgi:thymidine kinase